MLEFKQFVPEAFCLKCHQCCRFSSPRGPWVPKLLDSEKQLFSSRQENLALSKGGEGSFFCFYLDLEDNKCSVYQNRPFECRLYPFLINKRNESQSVCLAIDPNCPYVAQEGIGEELHSHARYLAEELEGRGFSRHLYSSPWIAQDYEGAVELVELNIEK